MELEDIVKAYVIGDSIAVTIPKKIREKLGIEEGTFIKIRTDDKRIILEIVK